MLDSAPGSESSGVTVVEVGSSEERWVVVKATAPHWFTLQVPQTVAKMMGLRVDLLRPGRKIAFLNRGPEVVRVVPVFEAPEDVAAEVASGTALAVATFTKDLLFTLPCTVQKHLQLRISRRGVHRVKGTDDLVAWMVPEREWELESTAAVPPAVHVYLTRSLFPARVRCTPC
jgi:hypothetical protein